MTQRPQKALLLLKPKAREENPNLAGTLGYLQEEGLSLVEPDLESADKISPTIIEKSGDLDLVIVGGGDGSLSAAAQGLKETGLPLGILPLGTANDLARTLNIPFDIAEAAKIIVAGSTRSIDLGEVNEHYFFNIAHIGLSEQVTGEMDSEEKRYLGVFSYGLGSWRALRKAESFSCEVTRSDGSGETLQALQISVGNGRNFGGGMVIAEDAAIDDGRLDLVCFRKRELTAVQLTRLFLIGVAMRRGFQRLFEEVFVASDTAFSIKTKPELKISADGEAISHTPACFRVHRSAVKVFSEPDPTAT